MRAVTDEGPQVPNSPKAEPVENLFTLLKIVSAPDTVAYFEEKYNTCEIRYGDLKKQLAEDILKVTLPIRERFLEIQNDEAYLARVVQMGARYPEIESVVYRRYRIEYCFCVGRSRCRVLL